ncbi:gamma-glutamylcyclotransferase [Plakobranchus ocellatus]|uniref:gamma-glutamylcyclotransferase n=1 Tax=Plakobranchus ocellatus TaxID=259542 RepID=A0AAV4AFY7_9GAST|nr:gamma-glutamylcyclotransferase [Plakobranchus ocellatus]
MATVAAKDTFKYFAYGSNLLCERILINNPSAKFYGIGKLSVIASFGLKNSDEPKPYLDARNIGGQEGKVSQPRKFIFTGKLASSKLGDVVGYQLGFDAPKEESLDIWLGSVATIFNADPTSYVYGVIWDMSYNGLESLDRQESWYNAIQVEVEVVSQIAPPGQQESADGADIGEHRVQCRTYQLENVTGAGLPSPHYKEVILMGARQNKLPQDYIAFLEAFPDNQVKQTPVAYKKVMEMLERERQDNAQ